MVPLGLLEQVKLQDCARGAICGPITAISDEEQAFRDEVRGFIRDRLPEDIRDRLRLGHPTTKSDIVRWQRILNEKGWAAYSWPKQHGGPGWTAVQRTIFIEEIQAAPAPEVNPFN